MTDCVDYRVGIWIYMKRIYLGIAFMLFGAVAVIGFYSPADWVAAICWGSGIIGLFNAIKGYYSKENGGAGNSEAKKTDKED